MKEEIKNTRELKYEEDRLLAMLADDSEFAFQALFERHKDHVYKVACLYIRSAAIAEEILQEVFMKVWTNRNNLIEVRSFEAWLYTVAKNAILNYNKRLAAEWKVYKNYSQAGSTMENTTDHRVRDAQFRKLLQDGMLQLSPQQRLVYKLAKEEYLSYKQIADRLAISPLTVKTHLSCALKTIRSYLNLHNRDLVILFYISAIVPGQLTHVL